MKDKLEFCLQVTIILICLTILFLNWTPTPAGAQITCGNEPPLKIPSNPKSNAWKPGVQFEVVVFGPTSDDEFAMIRDGAVEWNAHALTNCSGVSFTTASPAPAGADPQATLPNNVVWYYRDSLGTQFLPQFRNIGGTQVWEIRAARVRMQNPWGSSLSHMKTIATHELGHGFGLENETWPAQTNRSIMGIATVITQCDTDAIKKVYCPAPSPSPSPTPNECFYETEEQVMNPSGNPNELDCQLCQDWRDNDCDYGMDAEDYKCWQCLSPIVIDIDGDGIELTSPDDGVDFDISGVGQPKRISWIQADDVWLALDRNGNNTIESGKELFGAATLQYNSSERNGFLALALYDLPENGGNADGVMDNHDAIFNTLRLWRDDNRNGFSEPSELHGLPSLGLEKIQLDHKESKRTDQYGNRFRFRAKVKDAPDAQVGRWAWDVFLLAQPSNPASSSLIERYKAFQPIRSSCRLRKVA